MPPKQNENNAKNKKDTSSTGSNANTNPNTNTSPNTNTNNTDSDYSKDSDIFQTTYEKVLSIINNVKDFIKKTSKTSQKLIDDLDWVIKVIINQTLYTYEVNKEKIVKQNEEYNKFINFVTKYNEEVIQMNKKHILVSSILNIGKKAELLLKPSLCLKKLLPQELQNLDYQKEKEKNAKRKSSIRLIGNIILNIYYKGLERQRKEKEEKEKMEKTEKTEKKEKEPQDRIINEKKENKIQYVKKEVKFKGHQAKTKSISFNIRNNAQRIKKLKTMGEPKNNTLSKISINDDIKTSSNFEIKSSLKKRITDVNKKEVELSKTKALTKKNTLIHIKKTMKDYYTAQINLNEPKNSRKNQSKTHYFHTETMPNKIRSYSLYTLKKYKTQIYKSKGLDNEINIKIDIEQNQEKPPLKTLIDKYFNSLKTITDKDFNIFEFKQIVGYNNVLPLIGYIILKTLGLLEPNVIALSKLDSFLYCVSDNYKESTLYHNSLHGVDVARTLCDFFINSNIEEVCETTVLDLLGMIISAMGHDLGHPGYTNNFHINATNDLAMTYNDTSCLENYHISLLFRILKKDENNIFEKFNSQNFKSIRKRMIKQILATDMANHGEVVSLIKAKIKAHEDEGQSRFTLLSGNEKTKFDEQQTLLNYLIHAADLSHNTKKFNISLKWVELLSEEFWKQGDEEKSRGYPISFLCDRTKVDIPSSQVGFIKGFIVSTYDYLVIMFPSLKYTLDNAHNNIKEWQKLVEQHRLRGWTPKKEKKKENKGKRN